MERKDSSPLRTIGYVVLILGLPLAALGATHPPNEYRAALGISALDCDGPLQTYMLAVPALGLYAAAGLIHALKRRCGRSRLVVAGLCFLVCAALIANIVRAAVHGREQAQACAQR